MLNLQPFNVPGLLIAADLREHDGDPEGALDVLDRAYAETPPDETANWPRSPITSHPSRSTWASSIPPARCCNVPTSSFPDIPRPSRIGPVSMLSIPRKAAADPGALEGHNRGIRTCHCRLSPVVFSPVPAALLMPHATGTERMIKNMQSRVQRNPKDPAAYSALGAAFFQRARETGDVEDFQLAEQALNKSLDLDKCGFFCRSRLLHHG